MGFKGSLIDYRKIQERRLKELKKVSKKTPITAARYMATKARSIAPKDTGNLIQHIIRNKNQVRISGKNPRTGFNYVHWVNETEGTKEITSWGKMYSDPAVHKTGTPRFATIARNSARQFFRNTMIKNTRKAITLRG